MAQDKNEDLQLENEYKISEIELKQVKAYVDIFKNNSFQEHYEVNNYISRHNLWNDFSEIRSMNTHGVNCIKGILPKFFAIVCKILEITGDNGEPLDKSEPY